MKLYIDFLKFNDSIKANNSLINKPSIYFIRKINIMKKYIFLSFVCIFIIQMSFAVTFKNNSNEDVEVKIIEMLKKGKSRDIIKFTV